MSLIEKSRTVYCVTVNLFAGVVLIESEPQQEVSQEYQEWEE